MAALPRAAAWPPHSRMKHKHLAIYGLVVALAVTVGALALWSFFERQSLVAVSEPLPKVTIVTADPRSRLAAAWVRLLTKAELEPTLVAADKADAVEGIVVFCDIPLVPPKLAH